MGNYFHAPWIVPPEPFPNQVLICLSTCILELLHINFPLINIGVIRHQTGIADVNCKMPCSISLSIRPSLACLPAASSKETRHACVFWYYLLGHFFLRVL